MTFETRDPTKPPHHTTYNSTLPTTLTMGHQAYVGYVTQDGKVRAIYVHWANPESTIPVLLKHYHDFAKVKDLVNLGGCSEIEKEVFPREGASHSFDNPQKGVTRFYMRDRGDDPEHHSYKEYDSVANFSEERFDVFIESMYLFKDDKWFYAATLHYERGIHTGVNFDFRPADPTGIIGFVDSKGRLTYKICEKGIHNIYEILLADYDAPDKAKELLNNPSELSSWFSTIFQLNVQFADSKPCARINNVRALLEKFDSQEPDFVPGAERIVFFDETTSQWFATAKARKLYDPPCEDDEDDEMINNYLDYLPDNLKKNTCIMPLRDLVVAYVGLTKTGAKTEEFGDGFSDFDIFDHYTEYMYSEIHPSMDDPLVVSMKGSKMGDFINDYRDWAYRGDMYFGNEFVFLRPQCIVDKEAEEFKKWQQAQINPRKRKSRDEQPKREV